MHSTVDASTKYYDSTYILYILNDGPLIIIMKCFTYNFDCILDNRLTAIIIIDYQSHYKKYRIYTQKYINTECTK